MRNSLLESLCATGRYPLPAGSVEDSTLERRLQGRHLLVVDDEPSIRALVKCLLEIEGCRVTETASATEALRLLPESEVDMLITDIQMPLVTGLELAQAVREKRPEIPILLMSASPPPQFFGNISAHCLFLEKPFSFQSLMGKVQQALKAEPAAAPVARRG